MLYVQIGDTEFISKVDARDFHHPGEMIDLAFDINKGHFFDPQTEEVIINHRGIRHNDGDASIVSLYANLTFFFITLGCFASVKVEYLHVYLRYLLKSRQYRNPPNYELIHQRPSKEKIEYMKPAV